MKKTRPNIPPDAKINMPDDSAIEIEFVWTSKRWDNQQAKIKRRTKIALQTALEFAQRKKLINRKLKPSLTIAFSHNQAVRKLNYEWRFKDKPTNVLSFPSPPMPGSNFIGDIVLAYETVAREAKNDQKDLLDHTIHLIVHGFLHLIGLDHEDDKDADAMEKMEIAILSTLGIMNPYHTSKDA